MPDVAEETSRQEPDVGEVKAVRSLGEILGRGERALYHLLGNEGIDVSSRARRQWLSRYLGSCAGGWREYGIAGDGLK